MDIDWVLAGKIVWGFSLVGWAILRWRPNRAARKTRIAFTDRSLQERIAMACSVTGLGIVPAIWVFLGFPGALDHATGPLPVIAGAIIFLFSLYLFRRTHKALGKMWSHSLDLREGHKLVTRGIYEKICHPMYSAFWLWALAQPFLIANWFAGLAGIIGFGALYFLRVGLEEDMMIRQFGDEYRAYMKRTWRLVPGIY